MSSATCPHRGLIFALHVLGGNPSNIDDHVEVSRLAFPLICAITKVP